MASVISAGTTSGTALNMTADTSGQLQLATGASATTAVTIDTSQNVGIGTTSPAVKTDIQGVPASNGSASTLLNLQDTTTAGAGVGGGITFSGNYNGTSSNANFANIKGIKENASAGDYATAMIFSNRANGGSVTERMRIDSSGKVGIGSQNPAAKLDISGGALATTGIMVYVNSNSSGANSKIQFTDGVTYNWTSGTTGNAYTITSGEYGNTSGTERMRIDSSGNFLVGTTTGLDGGNGATIKQASYYISSYRVSTTTGNYIHAFYSDVGGTATAKYAIYANGTAGAISDERYKKNIEPSRNYLDDLTKIDVIKYNWATDDENTPKELGFSAQQVETIFPGLVDTVDNKDADGNVLINQKILKRDVFLPMLVKAIQEQQTIINDLKARIETLESK